MSGEQQEPARRTWLERLSSLLTREPQDREQLMSILRDAEERDILSAEMLNMIESVVQVADMQVRDVMIPKSQMVVFEHNCDLETILPLVIESGHSRFPVLDETGNDVIGMVLAKDLLKFCFKKSVDEFKIDEILRPVVFVPQSKRLDILLREFRVKRNHMAIVIDEYGHVAGLVTIEDVLEQIVGDIEDEYDTDEDLDIKPQDDNIFVVKASTKIEDFNEFFDVSLSDAEFDTIGGLVLQGFGYLPKRGEVLALENFRFKILHSDNRRIYLLEIAK